jgi:hypothetical protein
MKKFCVIIVLFFIGICVYGQQMPLNKIAPRRSAFYQETTGKAIIDNESYTYWLTSVQNKQVEKI